MESVQHLQERVHDPLDFPMFFRVGASFADGVKFVEQHDHRTGAGEFKHLAEIRGGLAEIG
jgi:hypothetical protein